MTWGLLTGNVSLLTLAAALDTPLDLTPTSGTSSFTRRSARS